MPISLHIGRDITEKKILRPCRVPLDLAWLTPVTGPGDDQAKRWAVALLECMTHFSDPGCSSYRILRRLGGLGHPHRAMRPRDWRRFSAIKANTSRLGLDYSALHVDQPLVLTIARVLIESTST